jgi:hypothetical protein
MRGGAVDDHDDVGSSGVARQEAPELRAPRFHDVGSDLLSQGDHRGRCPGLVEDADQVEAAVQVILSQYVASSPLLQLPCRTSSANRRATLCPSAAPIRW